MMVGPILILNVIHVVSHLCAWLWISSISCNLTLSLAKGQPAGTLDRPPKPKAGLCHTSSTNGGLKAHVSTHTFLPTF